MLIIKTNKNGKDAITQLCDIALKYGGMQNIQGVSQILNSIQDIEEPLKKELLKSKTPTPTPNKKPSDNEK